MFPNIFTSQGLWKSKKYDSIQKIHLPINKVLVKNIHERYRLSSDDYQINNIFKRVWKRFYILTVNIYRIKTNEAFEVKKNVNKSDRSSTKNNQYAILDLKSHKIDNKFSEFRIFQTAIET